MSTEWFDKPDLQGIVGADLTRMFTPAETIAIMTGQAPFGAPGASGMQYSNTDYVLLGDVVARLSGAAIGDRMKEELFSAIPLPHTTYQFDNPAGLVSGWFEYQGLTLDMTTVPQESASTSTPISHCPRWPGARR